MPFSTKSAKAKSKQNYARKFLKNFVKIQNQMWKKNGK